VLQHLPDTLSLTLGSIFFGTGCILPTHKDAAGNLGRFKAWNDDLIAQIRRCGRAAGRRLEYKVRTFAREPRDRDDRRIVVWVVVTASNPDDEGRIHQRGELLVQETLNKLLG
jgi:hypothetical protein